MIFMWPRKLVTASSLHKQIVARLSVFVLILGLFVAGSSIGVIGWLYQKTDAEHVNALLSKADLLLGSEHVSLKRAVRDYAVWTDAYQYVYKPQRKFETDNFTQQSLTVMRLDFVAIIRSPNRLIFSSQIDPAIADQKATPAIQSEALKATFPKLPEWDATTEDGEAAAPHSYLTFIDGRPVLMGVSRIFDSQESRSDGLMVFGRYLDGEYLTYLQKLADSELHIVAARPTEKESAPFYKTELIAAKPVEAWSVPDAWLQIKQEVDWGPRYFVIGVFVSAILFVMFVAAWVLQRLLERLVVRRIEVFADLAWRRTQGERVYWPIKGNNELDALARAFNGLMDEVQAAQKNLHALSVTDALTTLGNRRGLEQEIGLQITSCQPGASLSMLLMDLDGFKLVNDSLGHAAGDALLQEVAQRMRQIMRKQDLLFRMGGDEFAVLMPNTDAVQAERMAERLLQQLNTPIHYGTHLLDISGSIGIAQWDGNADGKELMRRADLAMYAAKNNGKSCICRYEKDMSGIASEQMRQEQALRRAVQEDLIEPYFQPVMDVSNDRVFAVEMLARWQWDGRFVPPADFIRLAEDLGLIHQLSGKLLQKGLSALEKFRERDPDLKLQVNISPLQFSDRQLAPALLKMLEVHALPPSALAVEMTESAMLLYPEQVEHTMRQLADAGVSLHLDDFGTGYSSLARLRDLPFDTIKLDRSFIVMMSEGDLSLSKAVFDMASSMKMQLIAEGVETQAELNCLEQIGYTRVQGFMFAEPMPEGMLIQWLTAHSLQK